MLENELNKLVSTMEKYPRKIRVIGGSFYICLPKPIVESFGRGAGSKVLLRRAIEKNTTKVVFAIEF